MSTSDGRGPVKPPARPSAGRVAGLIALIWGVGVAFTLTVASDTRIGPVVYKFTRTHGVHLGDVYATLGVTAVAVLLTVWVVMDHGSRRRRYQRYLERRQLVAESVPLEPEVPLEEQQTMIVAYAREDDEPYDDEFDYYDEPTAAYQEATQEIPRARHARFDD